MRLGRLAVIFAISVFFSPVSNAQTMSLPGQFSVSETGAATYTIPIEVPPGVAGMEPKLALVYNSQSGNGLLGMGWSLSGLSAITRCPRTMAQDGVRGGVNYDLNDRYCLDGQRLILMSGTEGGNGAEYRTERESFDKIVAYTDPANTGGPAKFLVKTKAGLTMEYGYTTDSRIEAQGKLVVQAWAVNKVTDSRQNYMSYFYMENIESGAWHLSRIDYAGSDSVSGDHSVSVSFDYEPRPDFVSGYQAGSLFTFDKRLRKIQFTLNQDLSSWSFNFDLSKKSNQSRLRGINVCQQDEGCRIPTEFDWDDSDGPLFTHWNQAFIAGAASNYGHYFLDVNGDGASDWIQVLRNGNGGWVGFSNGDGTFFNWKSYSPHRGALNSFDHYFSDVNGDGLSDWIQVFKHSNGGWVGLNLGNGDFEHWTSHSSSVGAGNYFSHHFSDLNGDGRADLIQISKDQNGGWVGLANGDGTFQTWTNYSAGRGSSNLYEHFFVDVNGDGLADWIQVQRNNNGGWVGLGRGDGTFFEWSNFSSSRGAARDFEHHFQDVNGDGLVDWIQIRKNGNGGWVGLNKGDGSFEHWTSYMDSIGSASVFAHYFSDLNGDGKTDLIQVSKGQNGGWIGLSSGNGTFEFWTDYSASRGTSNGFSHFFSDVSGDGLADWIQISSTTDSGYLSLNNHGNRVAIKRIREAEFATVSIARNSEPISIGGNYVPPVDGYPRINLSSPVNTVQSVFTHGYGSIFRETRYSYGNAIAELGTGRGFLGFQWVQSEDVSTGLVSRTWYRQDWPFVGLVDKVERGTSVANRSNLGLTTYTYDCTDFDATPGCLSAPGKRYFPYSTRVEEKRWDLNGTAL
ncbi:MAG: FG-GAP-like repeat-containing protein, partial [Pseudomonadota bacterium]